MENNDYSGLIYDEDDFDEDLYNKFVNAEAVLVSDQLAYEHDEGFHRIIEFTVKVEGRTFDLTVEASVVNDRGFPEVKGAVWDDSNERALDVINDNKSIDSICDDLVDKYCADWKRKPDYLNDEPKFSIDFDTNKYGEEIGNVDLIFGIYEHKMKFWALDNSGNDGRYCNEYGNVCDFRTGGRDEIFSNPYVKAIESYVRSEIGDYSQWEADYSQVVDAEDGETLAHWAARNEILPDDFIQWKLKDKDGTTVIETAILNRGLPDDFKDFGLKFKSAGKTVTVADFIQEHGVKGYEKRLENYNAEKREKEQKAKLTA